MQGWLQTRGGTILVITLRAIGIVALALLSYRYVGR
jgi:hypothetical protein